MPRRETYELGLRCDQCQRTGTAEFSEAENPVYAGGDLNPRLESVSEGFKIVAGDILCTSCNSVVRAAGAE